MLFLKIIRTLGKLIRGGATPTQIFLASLLGVFLGMIPGINLTLLAGVVLLLVLNANIALALLGFAIGKLLCVALAPVTFQIGYVIIHRIGLEGLFSALSDTPVLALMNLHVYCLVGGLPVVLVVGCSLGLFMAKSVVKVRAALLKATQNSEAMAKFSQHFLSRLLARALFGKQKVGLAEELQKEAPFFRKSGVILAAVVVVIAVAAELLLMDVIFKRVTQDGIAYATGAEVNVARAHLSLLGGELEIQGLQVTDPQKPTHNLVQADDLRGDISVRDLLTGRLAIDELKVSAAASGTLRKTPGKVYVQPQDTGIEIPDSLGWYLQKTEEIKKYQQYLQKVKEYLDKRKAEQEKNKESLKELARKRGYLKLSAQNLIAKHPTWTIHKLTVDKISVGDGSATYSLDSQELSSNPELNKTPMTIKVAQSGGMEAAVNFNFEKPDSMHQVTVHAPNVALGKALKLSDNAPLDVTNGLAAIDLNGMFNAEKMSLPVALDIKNLQAQTREGKSVLGLDPGTANEIFQNLTNVAINAVLEGNLTSPTVKIDAKQVLANLKDSLIKAGKTELANRANEQIDKLRGEVEGELNKVVPKDIQGQIDKVVPDSVKEGIKNKLPKGLPGGLDSLLPGSKKKEETERKTE